MSRRGCRSQTAFYSTGNGKSVPRGKPSGAWRQRFGGSRFLQNVGNKLPINNAPYPRRLSCSSTVLWKTQIAQFVTGWSLRWGLLVPLLIPKMEEHPLSAVPDYRFNIFRANFLINMQNLRAHQVVVTKGQINLIYNSSARRILLGYKGKRPYIERCTRKRRSGIA